MFTWVVSLGHWKSRIWFWPNRMLRRQNTHWRQKGKPAWWLWMRVAIFQGVLTKGDLKRHNVASGSIEQVYNRSPKHIVSASEEEILTQARNIFETYSSINKIPVLDAERHPVSFVFTCRNNTMDRFTWRNNTINRNYDTWNDTYAWAADGDEWSGAWGSQKAQWYGALYPRVAPWLPAKSVLEIAPGHGRWTEFLIPLSEKYRGVDLSPNCADFCKRRFSGANHASFFTNDGLTLPMIEDRSCNFVFSFDSLVHVELDVNVQFDMYQRIERKNEITGTILNHRQRQSVIGEKAGVICPWETPFTKIRAIWWEVYPPIFFGQRDQKFRPATVPWGYFQHRLRRQPGGYPRIKGPIPLSFLAAPSAAPFVAVCGPCISVVPSVIISVYGIVPPRKSVHGIVPARKNEGNRVPFCI